MTTERNNPRIVLIGLLAGMLVWSFGCRTAAEQASIHLHVGVPPEMRADYELFADNCSKCHSVARAINAPITDVEHWDRYVARMMRTPGSGISPNEAPGILRFLHWHTKQRAQRAEGKP